MTDYTLDILTHAADVLVVRLTPPGGGEMQSTRIAFLPGGYIVIHGDLCPGANGLVSCGGYDVGWFANGGKPKTPEYLAEKFGIPTVFDPKRAAEYLRERADEEDDALRAGKFQRLAKMAADIDARDTRSVDSFCEEVEDRTGPDHAEAFYGPDPKMLGLLCEIQVAFARLWTARARCPMGKLAEFIVPYVTRVVAVLEAAGFTEADCPNIDTMPGSRLFGEVSVVEAGFLRVFAGRDVVRVGCAFSRWEGEIDGVRIYAHARDLPEGRTVVRLLSDGPANLADLNPHSDVPFSSQASEVSSCS